MYLEENQLENQINDLKNELIKTAEIHGISSHTTLSCSQELDKLIILAMKLPQDTCNKVL